MCEFVSLVFHGPFQTTEKKQPESLGGKNYQSFQKTNYFKTLRYNNMCMCVYLSLK